MKKYHMVTGTLLVGSLLLGGVQTAAFAQATAPAAPTAPTAPATPPKAPAAPTTAPATPSAAPAAPTAASAPATASSGEIHANKKSKVYHLSTCPGYAKISAKNMMSFATEDEATKAGYRKAKNCK